MGTIFTSLILNFIRTQSILSLSCAAFSISLLQNVRPSNFFVVFVPLLLLLLFKKTKQGILPIGVSTVSPFLMIFLAGKITRIPEYNNAGNAWATLYGLIHKNSDWTLAYTRISHLGANSDYEISQRVRNLVLKDLQEDPLRTMLGFTASIVSNLRSMLASEHFFFLPDNLAVPLVGTVLSILLFLFMALRILKLKVSSGSIGWFILLLAVTASTILSYATYWKSEAPRVLSSTLIFSASILLVAIKNPAKALESPEAKESSTKITVTTICAIIIGVLSIASNHTGKNQSSEKQAMACAESEFYFFDGSITTQPVNKVKFMGLFEWEQSVRELRDGYLTQGLGSFSKDVTSIQTYTHFQPLPNRCYRLSFDGGEFPTLVKLGFGYTD